MRKTVAVAETGRGKWTVTSSVTEWRQADCCSWSTISRRRTPRCTSFLARKHVIVIVRIGPRVRHQRRDPNIKVKWGRLKNQTMRKSRVYRDDRRCYSATWICMWHDLVIRSSKFNRNRSDFIATEWKLGHSFPLLWLFQQLVRTSNNSSQLIFDAKTQLYF